MKKLWIVLLLFVAVSGFVFPDDKQSPILPIIFNTLPGFGVGSYVQGDIQTGNIILVGDLIAASMITGGFLSYYSEHNESTIEPIVCFSVGGLLYLSMKVFGFIGPIRYNNNKDTVKLMSTGNNIFLSFSF